MGEIELAPNRAPARVGGTSYYARTQTELAEAVEFLKQLRGLVELVVDAMQDDADGASSTSKKAAESGFDRIPVELAKVVGDIFKGVGKDGRPLLDKLALMIAKADNALTTHQRLYGRLHRVRSQRTNVQTPNPGAFVKPKRHRK